MASKTGIWNCQFLAPDQALYPQHNAETNAPGLPVKADELIYQGCLVAYDPANSQAQAADPAMPATAKVIGVTELTVDNRDGAKGALKVRPRAGVVRLKNDGNLTAAHLYKQVRVVDDHTVGVLAGDGDDRPAGLLVGLDGTGFAWVLILPADAQRGPVEHDLTADTVTTPNGNDAGTTQTLANALKAEINKVIADQAAIYGALVTHGLIAPSADY